MKRVKAGIWQVLCIFGEIKSRGGLKMMKSHELAVMKAVALCHKAWLKPEEAMIYCNLGRTQLAKKCLEYGIYKNNSGYLKRAALDLIVSGAPPNKESSLNKFRF